MSRPLHHLLCVVLAVLATVVAYAWNDRAQRMAQVEHGLAWARQVTTQIDALALHAREKQIADPLGFATGMFTQGQEPRVLKVFKLEGTPGMNALETHSFDRGSGIFDYTKVLQPEAGRGVRIQIQAPFQGFLGARKRLTSDLFLAAFFSIVLLTTYLASVWVFGLSGERKLKKVVTGWVSQARVVLTQFGTHIRELLRGEQMLMKNAADAHGLLAALEAKIQDQLHGLQEVQRSHWDHAQMLKRAETLTLSAVIEASRLGPGGKRLAEINEELHRLVLKKQELIQSGGDGLESTAQSMEDWAEDARKASEMMITLFGASRAIGEQLKGTTENVMTQAKLMKELNIQLSQDFPIKLRTKLDDDSGSSSGNSAPTGA
ncbi:MAG TPA: hypothetical protein VM598_00015 [Bdellovibrionota bacterium]|nr:hypothetical protein [Bdellovibrionota bacterium]